LFIEQEECVETKKWSSYKQKLELISIEEKEIKAHNNVYKKLPK